MADQQQDWEIRQDEAGNSYYFNLQTGETIWQNLVSTNTYGTTPGSAGSLWTEQYDEHGNLYYMNVETLETRWDKPAEEFGSLDLTNATNNNNNAAYGSTELINPVADSARSRPTTADEMERLNRLLGGDSNSRPSTAEQMNNLNALLGGGSSNNSRPGSSPGTTSGTRGQNVTPPVPLLPTKTISGDTTEGGFEANGTEVITTSSGAEQKWMMFINEADGVPYYYNVETGECTWDLPGEYATHTGLTPPLTAGTSLGGNTECGTIAMTPELEEKIKRALEAATPKGSSRIHTPGQVRSGTNTARPVDSARSIQSQLEQVAEVIRVSTSDTPLGPIDGAEDAPPSIIHVTEVPPTIENVTSARVLNTSEVVDHLTPVKQAEEVNVSQSNPEQSVEEPLSKPQTLLIEPTEEEIKTPQVQTLEEASQAEIPMEPAVEAPVVPVENEPLSNDNAMNLEPDFQAPVITEAEVIPSDPVSTAVPEVPPPTSPSPPVEHISDPVLHEEVIEVAPKSATPVSSSTEEEHTAKKAGMDQDVALLTIQCAARCFLAMCRFRIKKADRMHRWIEALDPESKLFFYYNTENNFIQWQKPSDFLPGGLASEAMIERMNHELSIVLAKRKRKQTIKSLPNMSASGGGSNSKPTCPPTSSRSWNATSSSQSKSLTTSVSLGPMALAASQKKRPVTSAITRKRVDLFQAVKQQQTHPKSQDELEKSKTQKQHENKVQAIKHRKEMAHYKEIYNTARKNFQLELQRLRVQTGAPLALARYGLVVPNTKEDQENGNNTSAEPPSAAELKAIWASGNNSLERRMTTCWEALEFQNVMVFRSLFGRALDKNFFMEEALRQRQLDIEQRIKRLEKKLATYSSSSMTIARSGWQRHIIIQQVKKKVATLINLQFWEKHAQDRTTNFWVRFKNRLEKMQPGERHEFVLNKHTDDGDTLLHLASWLYGGASGQKNGKEMLHALISLGMNVNAIDNTLSRMTPLHEAARAGHVEACAFLLAAGARMDAVDASGDTPLHWACRNGSIKVARLLLQRAEQVEAIQLQYHMNNVGSSTHRSTTSSVTSTSTTADTILRQLNQHLPEISTAPPAPSVEVGAAPSGPSGASAELLLSKSVVGMNLKCSLKELFHLKNHRNKRAIDLVIKKYAPSPTEDNNNITAEANPTALVKPQVKKGSDLAQLVTQATSGCRRGSILLEFLQNYEKHLETRSDLDNHHVRLLPARGKKKTKL